MRTLVDMIAADISRTVDAGPDWVQIMEDAVLRQDMEWLLLAARPVGVSGRGQQPHGYGDTHAGEDGDQRRDRLGQHDPHDNAEDHRDL